MNKTICFVAGKSAGHILPALTIAEKLKRTDSNQKVVFFSNHNQLDQDILSKHKFVDQHHAFRLMQIPYKKPWLLPKFLWQLAKALYFSLNFLKKLKPQKIISTGGLISIPVCLAAKHLKIPVIIYELNVQPGKATKFMATSADEINVCFKKTIQFFPAAKCKLSTYPIRFTAEDYRLSRQDALNLIKQENSDFSKHRKTILVIGGSQGSLFINKIIRKFITTQKQDCNLQIIHQIGYNDNYDWQNFYRLKKLPAIIFSYNSNLMPYYIAADLIICRSGAGTLAEIIPLKKPCITIPLQTGYTSHQLENAQEVANENSQIQLLKQIEIEKDFNIFYQYVSAALI